MKKLVKQLNLEQRIAYEAVKAGLNVFITGGGGVGKSFLIDVLSACFKSMAILAPTGIAALNVSGETIHSFFKLPFGSTDIHFLTKLKRGDKKRINAASIILIDEISMTRCDTMDVIDQKLRLVTGKNKPFGGKQVVIVGDFAQIEPVARKGSEEHKYLVDQYGHNFYAFNSKAWQRLNLVPFVLTEPVRHGEDELIKALRNIRMGNNLEKSIAFLNQRVANDYDIDTLRLVTTNRQCDDNNEDRYERLEGKEYIFKAKIIDNYKERPSPEELFLKVGCRVIFTSNGSEDDIFVNGDMGEVIKLDEKYAKVKLDRGPIVNVFAFKFESHAFEPNSKGALERVVKGSFEQLPLKLAYSITVHKSQGATLDQAVVDFSGGSFAYGQVYVALSRVRTLAGLFLTQPLKLRDIKVNKEAVEFTKAMSIMALQRREEDIKRFNINLEEFKDNKATNITPKEKEGKCKTTATLKQIILNQLIKDKKDALTLTLENLEQAGVTTYFELDNKEVKDGGFVFKSKKYTSKDVFEKPLIDFLREHRLIGIRGLTDDVIAYIKFLNTRAVNIPFAKEQVILKEKFLLSIAEKDRLKVLLNKIEDACNEGQLSLDELSKVINV